MLDPDSAHGAVQSLAGVAIGCGLGGEAPERGLADLGGGLCHDNSTSRKVQRPFRFAHEWTRMRIPPLRTAPRFSCSVILRMREAALLALVACTITTSWSPT